MRPRDLVMVGDSFENDVLPAAAAGITALWLNTTDATRLSGPLFSTVFSLREIPAILLNLN